jgi:hypothetical protein
MKYIKSYERNFLKTYEEIKEEPQIGDYVVCTESRIQNMKQINTAPFTTFISNNIGKLIKYLEPNQLYSVKYKNIPDNIKNFFENSTHFFIKEDILYFSKNKEHLEDIIKADKYNL